MYLDKIDNEIKVIEKDDDYLHARQLVKLCVDNSEIDWADNGFCKNELNDLLDLSIKIDNYEKVLLAYNGFILEDSEVNVNSIYTALQDEMKHIQNCFVCEKEIFLLLFKNYSGEELSRKYSLINPDSDRQPVALKTIQKGDEESHYLAYIESSTEKSHKAKALVDYAQYVIEKIEDLSKADTLFNQAIFSSPDSGFILANYALFLAENKRDFPNAIMQMNKAIKSDPDNISYLVALAWILQKSGFPHNEIEDLYIKSLEIKAKDPNALLHYAAFLSKDESNYKKVNGLYKKALKYSSNSASVYSSYIYFLDSHGKMHEKAVVGYDMMLSSPLCFYYILSRHLKEVDDNPLLFKNYVGSNLKSILKYDLNKLKRFTVKIKKTNYDDEPNELFSMLLNGTVNVFRKYYSVEVYRNDLTLVERFYIILLMYVYENTPKNTDLLINFLTENQVRINKSKLTKQKIRKIFNFFSIVNGNNLDVRTISSVSDVVDNLKLIKL